MELTKVLFTLIADGLSASTQKKGDFWREFCNGATLHRGDPQSGESLIG